MGITDCTRVDEPEELGSLCFVTCLPIEAAHLSKVKPESYLVQAQSLIDFAVSEMSSCIAQEFLAPSIHGRVGFQAKRRHCAYMRVLRVFQCIRHTLRDIYYGRLCRKKNQCVSDVDGQGEG